MNEPKFLALAEWGGTANGWPLMTLPAVGLWVHHSVTNEDLGVHPTEDAIADFLELDDIGFSRGHGGISYSYAIHPNGTIGEGQGIHRGAHTAGDGCNHSGWGHNPCSFGVCFIGNYDEDVLTSRAISSFQWLRDKLLTGGVLVGGAYPTGGHRDAPGNATGCPGGNIEANLALLRAPYSQSHDEEPPDMQILRAVGPGESNEYLHDRGIFQINADQRDALSATGVAVKEILQVQIDRIGSAYPPPPAGGKVNVESVVLAATQAVRAAKKGTNPTKDVIESDVERAVRAALA